MSRPWMPFYVADYLADTTHLSAAEHGAYLLLIFHYWQRGSLPDDDARLSSIARMPLEQWHSIRPTVSEFFAEGWKHQRIEKELAEAKAAYERRAKAGSKGGLAKSANLKSSAEQSSNASSNATPMPEHCSSNHNHNHRDRDKSLSPNRAQARASVDDEAFRRFWETWPEKVAKDAARKAFPRALAAAGSIEALLDGVERYKATKPHDRQWMHPATFLNGRRWEDAPSHQQPRGSPSVVPMNQNRNGIGALWREFYEEQARENASTIDHEPAEQLPGVCAE